MRDSHCAKHKDAQQGIPHPSVHFQIQKYPKGNHEGQDIRYHIHHGLGDGIDPPLQALPRLTLGCRGYDPECSHGQTLYDGQHQEANHL